MSADSTASRGFSLVGMLITLVCMVVLFTIGMSAMNKAVTGEGSAVEGTVRSVEDQMYLYALHQAMVVHANDNRERFLVPSVLVGDGDPGYVWPVEGYDYGLYDPQAGVHWDPKFKADLSDLSNTSFAHVPLHGERFRRHWKSDFSSTFPILGNRGPKDGIDDPNSWTYGKNGVWGGHLVFGDGHIDFVDTFTPPNVVFDRDGERYADNVFAVEDGPDGRDAILSFTREMTDAGPVLQHD
jgi:hypothetical protein